jgi:hypothetical protein
VSISTTSLSIQARPTEGHVTECDAITRFIQMTGETTIPVDPISIVNLYVSLKSKPMAILTGTAHSGKSEVVRSLAQYLTDGDPIRYQMMNGHAWWAEKTHDVAFFIETQTRFNTVKLLAVIEEAWQPENTNRVFVACLTHMSPAEVMGFFSEVASQLQRGQIMYLPRARLSEPIPYPPNLCLIGTMDTTRFDWSDEDLLSKTTMIQWLGDEMKPTTEPERESFELAETGFLPSLIRDEAVARQKLRRILASEQLALHPVLLAERLLNEHKFRFPVSVKGETLIYLANAWSKEGIGLFDQVPPTNLAIALDLAMAQILLPRVGAIIRDCPTLQKQLREVMTRFPRSAAFLERLN